MCFVDGLDIIPKASLIDKGTLCHLRNVIDRRNISASGADNFNACDAGGKMPCYSCCNGVLRNEKHFRYANSLSVKRS